MRATDIISMSFEGLNSRKFRFALNLIGILIGCAAVTGLITLTQEMSVEIRGQLGSLGGSTITVMAGSRFGPGSNMGNQANTVTLDWREVKIISGLSEVKLVAPIASGGSACARAIHIMSRLQG
jgi:hypothetical protein